MNVNILIIREQSQTASMWGILDQIYTSLKWKMTPTLQRCGHGQMKSFL